MFSAAKAPHNVRWKCIVLIIGTLLGIFVVGFQTGNSISYDIHWPYSKPQPPSSPASKADIPNDIPLNDAPSPYKPVVKVRDVIQERFDERIALKNKVCNTPAYQHMNMTSERKYWRRRMIPLANGRIEVCGVAKVGTTYMQVIENKVLRRLASRSGGRGPAKRMIMVREPYSRLMSAYIGKIATNTSWQRNFGASIIRKFRPLATEKAKKCGHDVTFSEFLKYFIHAQTTGWRRNNHFIPIYKHCNICSYPYDFIGHLETIKDDLSSILKSVNVSVDMDFSDEEQTLKAKASGIVNERQRILNCGSMCSAMSKVWWSFHARGLISTDIRFSMNEERCKTINPQEFADLAWDAHLRSVGRIDKSKQKREALVSLFLQTSLEDRLKVRYVMGKDFELYGYEAQPDDIFPEMKIVEGQEQ